MADEQHDQAAGDLPADLASPARRALAAAGYARLEQLTRSARPSFGGCMGWGPRRSTSSAAPWPPAAAPSPTPSASGTGRLKPPA
jgi:hypothetical protein